jgi:hypothetical protein
VWVSTVTIYSVVHSYISQTSNSLHFAFAELSEAT